MNKVILGDWLNNNIEDKSIDVIMADPPYFEVKGDFDFIWSDFEAFLKDVEKWAIECKRVLKDNGSLFWWGHAKKIAYAQIIFDKYFNLGNSLVWEKKECQTKAQDYGQARYFAPITERCLFYSNDWDVNSLNELTWDENNFKEIKDYFKSERDKTELSYKDINTRCFESASNGGGIASNILTPYKKKWNFPTKENYESLQKIGICSKSYIKLKQEYEEKKLVYRELMRPFNNHYKFNDVIKHSQQSNISKLYDHDTIKPVSLITQLLEVTTRKDSKILIPFGGSGTDVEACIDLGLDYICYEIDEKHYATIKAREKECLKQPSLF